MSSSRAIAEYHDFLVYVLVCAPDTFPVEDYLQSHEQMSLTKAFDELFARLPAIMPRVKDDGAMSILRELLHMSLEAYQGGNDVRGARILQEFEGRIWPKHETAAEFTPEAVARLASRSAGA